MFAVLEKWARSISKSISLFGAIALVIMMLIVFVDVAGRFSFDKPFIGSYEIVEFLMVLVVFLGFPYAQFEKQHVNVEIIISHLGSRVRALVDVLIYLICLAVMVLIAWGGLKQTFRIFEAKQVSLVLLIPQWPFQLVVGIGSVIFCFVLIIDLLGACRRFFQS